MLYKYPNPIDNWSSRESYWGGRQSLVPCVRYSLLPFNSITQKASLYCEQLKPVSEMNPFLRLSVCRHHVAEGIPGTGTFIQHNLMPQRKWIKRSKRDRWHHDESQRQMATRQNSIPSDAILLPGLRRARSCRSCRFFPLRGLSR